MNPRSLAKLFVTLAIALLCESAARAVDYVQLDPTGSSGDANYPVSGGYTAFGINDAGLVVGNNNFTGILWSGGSMFSIPVVGARYSSANGIANSAGGNTIVGTYLDNNYGSHGFTLSGWSPAGSTITGTLTFLDFPSATGTGLNGINDSLMIVGNSGGSGFVLNGSNYTPFHIAGSYYSDAYDINNANVIVGTYQDNTGFHGYVASLSDISGDQISTFTTIDAPIPGTLATHLTGINDTGDLTGWYQDASGREHGFFIDDFTPLDYAGINPANFLFRDTRAYGVNAADQVVGNSVETVLFNGAIGSHAFLATSVPEPGTLSLAMLLVPIALAGRHRRSH